MTKDKVPNTDIQDRNKSGCARSLSLCIQVNFCGGMKFVLSTSEHTWNTYVHIVSTSIVLTEKPAAWNGGLLARSRRPGWAWAR
jgi:hypothetical protein